MAISSKNLKLLKPSGILVPHMLTFRILRDIIYMPYKDFVDIICPRCKKIRNLRKNSNHKNKNIDNQGRLIIKCRSCSAKIYSEEELKFIKSIKEKVCGSCFEIKSTEYFKKDKDRSDGLSSWCRKCNSIANKRYYKENLNKHKNYYYKKTYNISYDLYLDLLEKQNYSCAICSGSTSGRGNFHLDHNHLTNTVRGLLCSECNFGLGKFKDDPILLKKAYKYLIERNK